MDIVDFLEARIAEQESAIKEGSFVLGISDDHENGSEDKSSLGERMLDECAQKRAIIASWKEAADAEGISPGRSRRDSCHCPPGHAHHPRGLPSGAPELRAVLVTRFANRHSRRIREGLKRRAVSG